MIRKPMGSRAQTLYDILGVNRSASQAEIRGAYLRLMKRYHPDLTSLGSAEPDRATLLNRCYATLKDPAAAVALRRWPRSIVAPQAAAANARPGNRVSSPAQPTWFWSSVRRARLCRIDWARIVDADRSVASAVRVDCRLAVATRAQPACTRPACPCRVAFGLGGSPILRVPRRSQAPSGSAALASRTRVERRIKANSIPASCSTWPSSSGGHRPTNRIARPISPPRWSAIGIKTRYPTLMIDRKRGWVG